MASKLSTVSTLSGSGGSGRSTRSGRSGTTNELEKRFRNGEIVWMRMGLHLWWPAQACYNAFLPETLPASYEKMPLMFVKFFQQLKYHRVYKITEIYKYQCARKMEFIRTGMYLSQRPKCLDTVKMFPGDVIHAESMTNGNPHILDGPEFKKIVVEEPLAQKQMRILQSSAVARIPTPEKPKKPYRCTTCEYETERMELIVMHYKKHSKDSIPSRSKPTVNTRIQSLLAEWGDDDDDVNQLPAAAAVQQVATVTSAPMTTPSTVAVASTSSAQAVTANTIGGSVSIVTVPAASTSVQNKPEMDRRESIAEQSSQMLLSPSTQGVSVAAPTISSAVPIYVKSRVLPHPPHKRRSTRTMERSRNVQQAQDVDVMPLHVLANVVANAVKLDTGLSDIDVRPAKRVCIESQRKEGQMKTGDASIDCPVIAEGRAVDDAESSHDTLDTNNSAVSIFNVESEQRCSTIQPVAEESACIESESSGYDDFAYPHYANNTHHPIMIDCSKVSEELARINKLDTAVSFSDVEPVEPGCSGAPEIDTMAEVRTCIESLESGKIDKAVKSIDHLSVDQELAVYGADDSHDAVISNSDSAVSFLNVELVQGFSKTDPVAEERAPMESPKTDQMETAVTCTNVQLVEDSSKAETVVETQACIECQETGKLETDRFVEPGQKSSKSDTVAETQAFIESQETGKIETACESIVFQTVAEDLSVNGADLPHDAGNTNDSGPTMSSYIVEPVRSFCIAETMTEARAPIESHKTGEMKTVVVLFNVEPSQDSSKSDTECFEDRYTGEMKTVDQTIDYPAVAMNGADDPHDAVDTNDSASAVPFSIVESLHDLLKADTLTDDRACQDSREITVVESIVAGERAVDGADERYDAVDTNDSDPAVFFREVEPVQGCIQNDTVAEERACIENLMNGEMETAAQLIDCPADADELAFNGDIASDTDKLYSAERFSDVEPLQGLSKTEQACIESPGEIQMAVDSIDCLEADEDVALDGDNTDDTTVSVSYVELTADAIDVATSITCDAHAIAAIKPVAVYADDNTNALTVTALIDSDDLYDGVMDGLDVTVPNPVDEHGNAQIPTDVTDDNETTTDAAEGGDVMYAGDTAVENVNAVVYFDVLDALDTVEVETENAADYVLDTDDDAIENNSHCPMAIPVDGSSEESLADDRIYDPNALEIDQFDVPIVSEEVELHSHVDMSVTSGKLQDDGNVNIISNLELRSDKINVRQHTTLCPIADEIGQTVKLSVSSETVCEPTVKDVYGDATGAAVKINGTFTEIIPSKDLIHNVTVDANQMSRAAKKINQQLRAKNNQREVDFGKIVDHANTGGRKKITPAKTSNNQQTHATVDAHRKQRIDKKNVTLLRHISKPTAVEILEIVKLSIGSTPSVDDQCMDHVLVVGFERKKEPTGPIVNPTEVEIDETVELSIVSEPRADQHQHNATVVAHRWQNAGNTKLRKRRHTTFDSDVTVDLHHNVDPPFSLINCNDYDHKAHQKHGTDRKKGAQIRNRRRSTRNVQSPERDFILEVASRGTRRSQRQRASDPNYDEESSQDSAVLKMVYDSMAAEKTMQVNSKKRARSLSRYDADNAQTSEKSDRSTLSEIDHVPSNLNVNNKEQSDSGLPDSEGAQSSSRHDADNAQTPAKSGRSTRQTLSEIDDSLFNIDINNKGESASELPALKQTLSSPFHDVDKRRTSTKSSRSTRQSIPSRQDVDNKQTSSKSGETTSDGKKTPQISRSDETDVLKALSLAPVALSPIPLPIDCLSNDESKRSPRNGSPVGLSITPTFSTRRCRGKRCRLAEPESGIVPIAAYRFEDIANDTLDINNIEVVNEEIVESSNYNQIFQQPTLPVQPIDLTAIGMVSSKESVAVLALHPSKVPANEEIFFNELVGWNSIISDGQKTQLHAKCVVGLHRMSSNEIAALTTDTNTDEQNAQVQDAEKVRINDESSKPLEQTNKIEDTQNVSIAVEQVNNTKDHSCSNHMTKPMQQLYTHKTAHLVSIVDVLATEPSDSDIGKISTKIVTRKCNELTAEPDLSFPVVLTTEHCQSAKGENTTSIIEKQCDEIPTEPEVATDDIVVSDHFEVPYDSVIGDVNPNRCNEIMKEIEAVITTESPTDPDVITEPEVITELEVIEPEDTGPDFITEQQAMIELKDIIKPEDTIGPDVINEPEVLTDLEDIIEPEVMAELKEIEPKVICEPDVITEPEDIIEPKDIFDSDDITEPDDIIEPKGIFEPEVITEPEVTTEPESIVEPNVILEPDVITEPEIITELEPCDSVIIDVIPKTITTNPDVITIKTVDMVDIGPTFEAYNSAIVEVIPYISDDTTAETKCVPVGTVDCVGNVLNIVPSDSVESAENEITKTVSIEGDINKSSVTVNLESSPKSINCFDFIDEDEEDEQPLKKLSEKLRSGQPSAKHVDNIALYSTSTGCDKPNRSHALPPFRTIAMLPYRRDAIALHPVAEQSCTPAIITSESTNISDEITTRPPDILIEFVSVDDVRTTKPVDSANLDITPTIKGANTAAQEVITNGTADCVEDVSRIGTEEGMKSTEQPQSAKPTTYALNDDNIKKSPAPDNPQSSRKDLHCFDFTDDDEEDAQPIVLRQKRRTGQSAIKCNRSYSIDMLPGVSMFRRAAIAPNPIAKLSGDQFSIEKVRHDSKKRIFKSRNNDPPQPQLPETSNSNSIESNRNRVALPTTLSASDSNSHSVKRKNGQTDVDHPLPALNGLPEVELLRVRHVEEGRLSYMCQNRELTNPKFTDYSATNALDTSKNSTLSNMESDMPATSATNQSLQGICGSRSTSTNVSCGDGSGSWGLSLAAQTASTPTTVSDISRLYDQPGRIADNVNTKPISHDGPNCQTMSTNASIPITRSLGSPTAVGSTARMPQSNPECAAVLPVALPSPAVTTIQSVIPVTAVASTARKRIIDEQLRPAHVPYIKPSKQTLPECVSILDCSNGIVPDTFLTMGGAVVTRMPAAPNEERQQPRKVCVPRTDGTLARRNTTVSIIPTNHTSQKNTKTSNSSLYIPGNKSLYVTPIPCATATAVTPLPPLAGATTATTGPPASVQRPRARKRQPRPSKIPPISFVSEPVHCPPLQLNNVYMRSALNALDMATSAIIRQTMNLALPVPPVIRVPTTNNVQPVQAHSPNLLAEPLARIRRLSTSLFPPNHINQKQPQQLIQTQHQQRHVAGQSQFISFPVVAIVAPMPIVCPSTSSAPTTSTTSSNTRPTVSHVLCKQLPPLAPFDGERRFGAYSTHTSDEVQPTYQHALTDLSTSMVCPNQPSTPQNDVVEPQLAQTAMTVFASDDETAGAPSNQMDLLYVPTDYFNISRSGKFWPCIQQPDNSFIVENCKCMSEFNEAKEVVTVPNSELTEREWQILDAHFTPSSNYELVTFGLSIGYGPQLSLAPQDILNLTKGNPSVSFVVAEGEVGDVTIPAQDILAVYGMGEDIITRLHELGDSDDMNQDQLELLQKYDRLRHLQRSPVVSLWFLRDQYIPILSTPEQPGVHNLQYHLTPPIDQMLEQPAHSEYSLDSMQPSGMPTSLELPIANTNPAAEQHCVAPGTANNYPIDGVVASDPIIASIPSRQQEQLMCEADGSNGAMLYAIDDEQGIIAFDMNRHEVVLNSIAFTDSSQCDRNQHSSTPTESFQSSTESVLLSSFAGEDDQLQLQLLQQQQPDGDIVGHNINVGGDVDGVGAYAAMRYSPPTVDPFQLYVHSVGEVVIDDNPLSDVLGDDIFGGIGNL